jgi:O-antigen ligase
MAWPALLLSAVALFGIILTGCRGALLSWMLFAALSWGFCRGRLKAGMLVSGSLAIPALLVWYLDQSGVLQSPNVFNRVAQVVQADGAGFDSGRIQMWIEALRQIAAHPLFGSGPEGYWLSGCCNRGAMQAHNFVLQFLMEFGAAGCAIVALLMFRVMRHLGGLAAIRSLVLANEGNKVLASMILAYLAYSLIDQTMYHLLPLLLIAPVAGLLAAGLAQARAAATMSV